MDKKLKDSIGNVIVGIVVLGVIVVVVGASMGLYQSADKLEVKHSTEPPLGKVLSVPPDDVKLSLPEPEPVLPISEDAELVMTEEGVAIKLDNGNALTYDEMVLCTERMIEAGQQCDDIDVCQALVEKASSVCISEAATN